MNSYDDEQPEPIDIYDEDFNAPSRPKIVLRRYDGRPSSVPIVLDEDAEPVRRVRWYHVVGALFLIAVLMMDTLAPVIQGVLEIIRFVPSTLGEPL